MTTTDHNLIDAIHRDRVAELDHAEAQAVCRAIGQRTSAEVNAVQGRLGAAGIDAAVVGDPAKPSQRHGAALLLRDATTALAAVRVLGADGYHPWEPIDGAAENVLRRLRSTLTIARTDDVTVVLDLRWPGSPLTDRFPDSLKPNENDYDAVTLPAVLWPLYLLVRPIRLAAERLGLRPTPGRALGPFLSTPVDLIDPLLDLADVGSSDTLVDLGCGDGRILRHAVAQRGCRAVGIESNRRLVAEARRQVVEAELADRITIVEGDANADELPSEAIDGSVFFLFVPAYAVPDVVARVLDQAQPGARIVVHEQHALPDLGDGVEPLTVPLLHGQGITVAHRIDV